MLSVEVGGGMRRLEGGEEFADQSNAMLHGKWAGPIR